MPRFTEAFLGELRERVSVLDLARKHFQLRKAGAEWQVIDDPSLKINPAKNIWQDFGKGQNGGDVFALEMHVARCGFEAAVVTVAQIAGLALPNMRARPNGPMPSGPRDDVPLADDPAQFAAGPLDAPARRDGGIIATYDYFDREGSLLYQVARSEGVNAKTGKRYKKTFPRRPAPDGEHWIWAIKAGEFLRGNSGDWYQAEGRDWPGAERRYFEAVEPILYRLPELFEELSEPPSEQRPIFIPEGEKDVDTLVAWGLVATTCIGGVNGWQPHFSDYFRGADVVVPFDNDQEGRTFAQRKAASLKGIARRIRLLDPRQLWPACPEKGDVTDWREKAGGTRDRLFEVLDKSPEWTPQPPESTFSARRYIDIDRVARPLTWTIKQVLQRGTVSLWYGPPSCGKSFLLTDASMAIARGITWMGKRTKPGLVVYQTGEGHDGFGLRLKAYRQSMRLQADDDIPFVYLPVRINLYADDADVTRLIAEIKAWASFYDHSLELVVIDTFNAAALGANENSNQDVGRVIARCRRIVDETGAHVAVVHHTPAAGDRPRGHSSLVGDVETTIAVLATENIDVETRSDGSTLRRTVRNWHITKQKDAPDRFGGSFVLKSVTVATDDDGDPVTSCIISPLETAAAMAVSREVPQGYAVLNPANEDIFRALTVALQKHGRPLPSGIEGDPGPGTIGCTVGQWQDALIETFRGHEEITETLAKRLKMRIWRSSRHWGPGPGQSNLIVKGGDFVWRTSRRVFRLDPSPAVRMEPVEPEPLLVPGEDQRSFGDVLDGRG